MTAPSAVPRFGRKFGRCILAVVALYSVYGVGMFVGSGADEALMLRLIGIVGFPLPLLVAPATYFAAVDHFDLRGEAGPGVRRRHFMQLGYIALCAYAAMHLGYIGHLSDAFISPSYTEFHGMSDAASNDMVPVAILLFVIVAGIGGAVTGRVTRGLAVGVGQTLRWVVVAVLVGCFVVPLVAVVDLAWHGVLPPPWIALFPPAVAFAFVCLVARRDCARLVRSIAARFRRRKGDPWNPLDVAVLDHAIRRVAAPAVEIDESRVHEIVGGVTDAAKGPARSRRDRGRRGPGGGRWPGMAGGFATSWACLTAGFLVLGGVEVSPPTVVSALLAGLMGAAGAVWTSR